MKTMIHWLLKKRKRRKTLTEEEFHPMCEVCGKYMFAVDPCMGHLEEGEDNDSD